MATREEALKWAAKMAAACRCAQAVFELLPDEMTEEELDRLRPASNQKS